MGIDFPARPQPDHIERNVKRKPVSQRRNLRIRAQDPVFRDHLR